MVEVTIRRRKHQPHIIIFECILCGKLLEEIDMENSELSAHYFAEDLMRHEERCADA